MSYLVPPEFKCPDHPEQDLTEAVKSRVEVDIRVSSLNFRGRRRRPVPFRVIVTCPGTDGKGHELEFVGSYKR